MIKVVISKVIFKVRRIAPVLSIPRVRIVKGAYCVCFTPNRRERHAAGPQGLYARGGSSFLHDLFYILLLHIIIAVFLISMSCRRRSRIPFRQAFTVHARLLWVCCACVRTCACVRVGPRVCAYVLYCVVLSRGRTTGTVNLILGARAWPTGGGGADLARSTTAARSGYLIGPWKFHGKIGNQFSAAHTVQIRSRRPWKSALQTPRALLALISALYYTYIPTRFP